MKVKVFYVVENRKFSEITTFDTTSAANEYAFYKSCMKYRELAEQGTYKTVLDYTEEGYKLDEALKLYDQEMMKRICSYIQIL